MKLTILTTSLIFAAATAFAGGGNSDAAKNMASYLQQGLGSAAPTVSGKDAKSNSGWGNNGSAIVAGDKVSDYGKSK